jgi:hypothetical protein
MDVYYPDNELRVATVRTNFMGVNHSRNNDSNKY